MDPYRSRRTRDRRKAPKTGVVADMVRQFADPYAFVRELVQNSIDAGAQSIDVRIELDHDGAIRIRVRDDGTGMPLEVIEGPLLTLFTSSKEEQVGKIGKYGVGFMSVFALDPDEVQVETWSKAGAFLVRLRRDHTYLVEKASPRKKSGTIVSVRCHGDRAGFESHANKVVASLRKWCRHARCPITVSAMPFEGRAFLKRQRVDTPLSITSPVTVTDTRKQEVIVVGYEAGSAFVPTKANQLEGTGSFAGFYNRGLTLYETTVEAFPKLEGIRFKVMSPSLRHTLSRDNVRRDVVFADVLDRVRDLAKKALPEELRLRQIQRATEFATAGQSDLYYATLVASAAHLEQRSITLPLVEIVEGRHVLTLGEISDRTPSGEPCVVTDTADELTKALAASGRPVVRVLNQSTQEGRLQASLVTGLLRPLAVVRAQYFYFLLERVEGDDTTSRLCESVESALQRAGASVDGVSVCRVKGSVSDRTCFVVSESPPSPLVLRTRDFDTQQQRWGRRSVLLNLDDRAVQFSLDHARSGRADVAGPLLARIALLEWKGAIEPRANRGLLLHTLEGRGQKDASS